MIRRALAVCSGVISDDDLAVLGRPLNSYPNFGGSLDSALHVSKHVKLSGTSGSELYVCLGESAISQVSSLYIPSEELELACFYNRKPNDSMNPLVERK